MHQNTQESSSNNRDAIIKNADNAVFDEDHPPSWRKK